MREAVKLSIIIVTYRSHNIISDCLTSLFCQNDLDEKELEVIIVDNSPLDDFRLLENTITQKSYDRVVRLYHNIRNGGYGQGNNLGIQHATGEIIAIMNPDIIHTESLFRRALLEFYQNPNLGMLGFKQMGGHRLSYYVRQEFQTSIFSYFWTKIANRLGIFDKRTMYLSGAYFFTTKTHFSKIGYFDENIFLYCEESDITQRFLQQGLDIKFVDEKAYLHDIDGRDDSSLQALQYLLDSVRYYCQKYSFDFRRWSRVFVSELRLKRAVFRLLLKREKVAVLDRQIQCIEKFVEHAV